MTDSKTPPPDDSPETTPLPPSRPSHQEPRQIGAFRILEKIGEGGMGIVYKAEQREPVRRLVALKVIKLGMDSKEVVARFEAERQALAFMNHPNVARVLDAGITEAGRPYFAMEFVAGVPLTPYCADHKLAIRQRLELFIAVCNAIQHAHQKGIIHRDLKPTNVLVAIFDGKPVPKVIDFGIAKATNQALTAHTIYTQTGALIGTPEYMSPEQAMTSGLDVDQRTDVYSLGVILYELLSGGLPFDAKALRETGIEGMARIIRETEPPKPSDRLTALSADPKRPTNFGQRGDLRAVQREIRGDLDWITLKAMEKDRTRRYESASALASDIQRHLDCEPVLARPPSLSYRLTKFVHKHKAGVVSAAVAAGLLLALAVAVFSLLRFRAERDTALAARKRDDTRQIPAAATEDEATASRFTADLFMALGNPADAKARMAAAIKRLDDGLLKDQPTVQSGCRITLAYILLSQNSLEEAQRQFETALSLLRLADGPVRDKSAAVIYSGLGRLFSERRDFRSAESQFRQALAAYRRLGNSHASIADTLETLATLRTDQQDAAGAKALRFQSLSAQIDAKTADLQAKSADAPAHRARATLLARTGRFKEALADCQDAIRLDPADPAPYFLAAILQKYLGEEEAYRQTSQAMLDRFAAAPSRETADHLAKTLLLSPTLSAPDLQTCSRLIDQPLALDAAQGLSPSFQLTKSLLEYRAARYQSALDCTDRARARSINSPLASAADLIAALTLHRMATPDKAQEAFKRAQSRLADTPKPTIDDLAPVEDFLLCQILLREAQELVQK